MLVYAAQVVGGGPAEGHHAGTTFGLFTSESVAKVRASADRIERQQLAVIHKLNFKCANLAGGGGEVDLNIE